MSRSLKTIFLVQKGIDLFLPGMAPGSEVIEDFYELVSRFGNFSDLLRQQNFF